jgi:hypothetical protein
MMIRISQKLLLLPMLLAASLSWSASNELGGTFSEVDVGTRPIGMGGAFAAVADDANAAFDNPAGMGFFDKDAHYATFTHANLFSVAGLTRDYIAYSQADTLGFGALGLSWNRFSADLNPETWTEDAFTYSGAKALAKGDGPSLSVGWMLQYLRVDSGFSDSLDGLTVGNGNASGYAIGLSLMLRLRPSLNLAVVMNDIYSNLAWGTGTLEILPPAARAGLAYHVTDQTLFSAEGRAEQTSAGFVPSSWHIGGEWWVFDGKSLMWDEIRNIGVRAGYYQLLANGDGGELSVGATLKADQWQLDYAYQYGLSSDALGATHRFGVGVNF